MPDRGANFGDLHTHFRCLCRPTFAPYRMPACLTKLHRYSQRHMHAVGSPFAFSFHQHSLRPAVA